MMTYEMIGVADQNRKTYESTYGTYNKKQGFVLNEYALSLGKSELLDRITHENCWSLKQEKPKPRQMTIQEINEALGYDVEIVEEIDEQCPIKIHDNLLEYILTNGHIPIVNERTYSILSKEE